MRNICKYTIIIFFIFCFIPIVKAEECTNATRIRLSSLASNIKVDYSLRKENGINVFYISIFNVSNDDIYVSYIGSDTTDENRYDIIQNKDTKNGTYTFTTTNIDKIVEYTFHVYSNIKECGTDLLRTLTLIKPKKNKYYDNALCKYEAVQDFYYCKEWIKNDFLYNEKQILEEIQKEIDKSSNIEKQKEDVIDKKTEEKEKKNNKLIIIGGIGAFIFIDVILVVIQLFRIKRYKI